jgi:ABC-type antimicrobial peptide transport system permease subunit
VVSSALVGPGQTQATGTGLDGAALSLKVIAAAVAVPSAPANGVIVDRTYAGLAAGLAPAATTVEQVWLAGGAQQAIEARLRAAGVGIASSSTTAAAAAAFARQGPALSSVLFLADAAAATLLAAGAAILDLYLSARRRRYEYAALSASGVPFRTLRRAVRTELALLLGFGIVVGVVIGAIAALVTLRSLPEFINAPPASVLSYVPPALPLVVMLVVAVAVLTIAAALASSTLIRGVNLDQLRETPT